MLILLRHGQTPVNAESRLQGNVDPPLDEVGIEQAQRAGDYIRRRWKIDQVITSSLNRTTQTAELAGFHDAVIDDRWRELDFGDYDQRRVGDVISEMTRRWRDDASFAPTRGESMSEMHARVSEACGELALRVVDENILVVTHATPIKSAAVWALGGPPSMILNLWVNVGTVTVLRELRGDLVLSEFNISVPDGAPTLG